MSLVALRAASPTFVLGGGIASGTDIWRIYPARARANEPTSWDPDVRRPRTP
jgi:hypothetical protein